MRLSWAYNDVFLMRGCGFINFQSRDPQLTRSTSHAWGSRNASGASMSSLCISGTIPGKQEKGVKYEKGWIEGSSEANHQYLGGPLKKEN